MGSLSLFEKYIFSSSILNGLFKLSEVYNCKVKRDETNNKITKMLVVEKIAIVSFHTIIGFYIFPFSLYNNLGKLELKLRNEKGTDYNFENCKENKTLPEYFYSF
jgi:hypothetical protein